MRAIVPNKSNNEIILVLQHFDNCVDKTVQAFMEGSASEVLKEWTVTGKKKNKKKKSKPKPAAEPSNSIPIPTNRFPFKRNNLRPPQRKVVLMVIMSTVPSMILSLWTHSVKVWRHFQQKPENWRILSLTHQKCWMEQDPCWRMVSLISSPDL